MTMSKIVPPLPDPPPYSARHPERILRDLKSARSISHRQWHFACLDSCQTGASLSVPLVFWNEYRSRGLYGARTCSSLIYRGRYATLERIRDGCVRIRVKILRINDTNFFHARNTACISRSYIERVNEEIYVLYISKQIYRNFFLH